jgi:hypothetical protein
MTASKLVEPSQSGLQIEVLLGGQQALYELEGGHEEDLVAALDELVANGADQVSLAASR